MATILIRDTTDWAGKYSALQAAIKMPYIKNTFIKPKHFVYRDMVVNLQTVIDTVNASPNKPLYIYVIADVVYFPKDWELKNQGYYIFARRFIYGETGQSTAVTFNLFKENAATLTLFTNEVVGSIAAIMKYSGGTKIIRAETYPDVGVQFARRADGHLDIKNLSNEDLLRFTNGNIAHVTDELNMSLSSLYQMASVMIEDDNDTARAILDWVKTVSTKSEPLFGHFVQSSTLLSELNLERSKVNFVPVLSAKIYEDIAQAYLDAVKEYETQYLLFVQDSQSKKDQILAGNLMLKCYKNATIFTEQLIKQAESNVIAAQSTLESTQKSMQEATDTRVQAGKDFQYGIAKWKEEMKLKAAFDICMALVSFGACAGKMFMGDPSAIATAGDAVKGAADAAKAGVKAVKNVSEFNQAILNFAKSMQSLSKIGKLLSGTAKFIEQIKKAVDKISSAENINDFTIPSSSDISAQAEWDVFRLQADDMLRFVEDEGIEGASEYRQSLDILSIYGKAQAAAQAALLQVNQEVVRLYLQKAMNVRMEESVKSYLETLESDAVANEKAKYNVFVLQLNMKRFMFNAIRNYVRAYKYWSLLDSKVKPSLSSNAKKLQEDVSSMKLDYADALVSFGENMLQDIGVEGGIMVEITDPIVLKTFREKGEFSFTVPLNEEEFIRYQRVRVTRVRVWLEDGKPNRNVRLTISNSGIFADRFAGKTYTFTSRASELKFDYNYEKGEIKIITDGKVAKEVKDAYFQATPFTEWKIKAPKKETPAERELVTKITLRFTGTAIGDPSQFRSSKPKEIQSKLV